MAWGQVHSVLSQGTAGAWTVPGPYVRLNTFQFGVGTQGYGPSPSYYSVVQPVSSGGGNGPGSFGSTAGCVYYAHKASAGPSMISFTGGFGVTSTFVDFTNRVGMAPGATKGITALNQAINYYATVVGGETVVSNRFKTIPQISNLILYFDVDQWMCVTPRDTSLLQIGPSGRELSSNYATWTHVPTPPTGIAPALRGYPNSLPWYLDFYTGGQDTGYIDFNVTGGFLFGAKDFAISYWVKFLSVPSTLAGEIVQFYLYDNSSRSVYTYITNDGTGQLKLGARVDNFPSGLVANLGTLSVPLNEWVLITLNANSTDSISLWVNDTLVDYSNYTLAPTLDATLSVDFGYSNSTEQTYYLNSLFVWNTFLTNAPNQIGSIFNETSLEFG
jgi:hypothetical protein